MLTELVKFNRIRELSPALPELPNKEACNNILKENVPLLLSEIIGEHNSRNAAEFD